MTILITRVLSFVGVLSLTGPAISQEFSEQTIPFESDGYQIVIDGMGFSERVGDDEKQFTRSQASQIGIDHANILTSDHFIPPYWNGRGVGSGDIDKDGYVDLVFASQSGVKVFMNQQGVEFIEAPLNIPLVSDKDVFITALIDWDNDGWLDLFLTSYADGNFWVKNNAGSLTGGAVEKLPGSPLVLTKALSFADVDRDGDLDAALGNWFYGYLKHYPPEDSDNYLLMNDNGQYTTQLVPGMAGETLSILLTDFSGDGNVDLIVGNDFAPPDYFYLGDGQGNMEIITRQSGMIPLSTNTTMSIDTADIDNDLDLDIFVAQIAASATGSSARMPIQNWDLYCSEIEGDETRQACEDSVDQRFLFGFGSRHEPGLIKRCEEISDDYQMKACQSMMLLLTATRGKQKSLCDKIPFEHTKFTCHNFFKPSKAFTEEEENAAIPITNNKNVLLRADGEVYTNQAQPLGLEVTGWSWNAKFADFDNDQWQDIFVVNGTWIRDPGTPTKFFFHNKQGKGFERRVNDFGLQNFMLQTAFTQVDIDNDGDLDIIANSTSGPIWFYRNNGQSNHSVQFTFSDEIGNHFGVGNKLIIYYGENNEKHQIREIKAGGGFLSFTQPQLHFGLGEYEEIGKVKVLWADGGESEINGPLPSNHRYNLTRSSTATVASE